MNNQSHEPSILKRTLAWINQHAYQPAKNMIVGKTNNLASPEKKKLLFAYLVNNQAESRKMGLNHIRNLNRKGDQKQHWMGMQQKLKKISHFWGKRQEPEERPIELICPICMDFLVGGVSTKCGHTFCWQCLDQAVLLNPGCPVCRSQIRGTDFTLSQELTAIIRRYLKRCSTEKQREHELLFSARAEQFQQWLIKRVLNPQKILSSDLVDVRDTQHIWCSGLIKQIWEIQGKMMALVHYIGWSSLYDEIIPLDSQRLAAYRLYSSRKDIPHYQLEANEGQVEGYVVQQPELDDISSSEGDEQEFIHEFQENIEIQIIEENDDDEQQMELPSAKPLHFYNPEE